jgi:tetratricopeptide (TPR) repeat protein
MKNRVMVWAMLFCVGFLATAQQKYALVLGNGAYQKIETLSNPVNDATDIAARLRQIGYQVELQTNLRNADMGRVIDTYIRRLSSHSSNEGFFWYAGHGVQINGENYLLPVDVEPEDDVAVKYSSFPLNRLLESFEITARNKVNIVVLDACRNNPFRNMPGGRRSLSRGLTVVENLPPDLFVLYSTAAGDVAADGERGKRNSPFAEAFMKHLDSPDDFSVVIRRITRDTLELTGNRQRPYHDGSIISTDYYSLNPRTSVPPEPVTPPPASNTAQAETFFYRGLEAYKKGDYDRAIADYTEAIRLNPQLVNAYYNRGNAYQNGKKDYDRTIADYTQAIRLNPQFGNAYDNRGLAYQSKKDYDRAIADHTEAIRLGTTHIASTYNNRGKAYQDGKGDYDRAIADYTEAIRLNPQFAIAYCGRGVAYYYKGDYDRSIRDYDEALRIDPSFTIARNNRQLAIDAKQKR